MNMRAIEPEWLDTLPAGEPSAIRSRADLRRVNWLMNNVGIVTGALRGLAPETVLDLGAGDGSFAMRVVQRLGWQNLECALLDRSCVVPETVRDGFRSMHCRLVVWQRDALHGLSEIPDCDVIFTNLFLHHFKPDALKALLHIIALRCRTFVACEPRRHRLSLGASRLLWMIGCNRVTCHDAVASVRAGFRDEELTGLWPMTRRWRVQERAAGIFSHLFVAQRR